MDCFFKCCTPSYSKLENLDDEPCNLMRVENRAIAMSYFAVGVVSSLIATPLNVYMVETLNSGILSFHPRIPVHSICTFSSNFRVSSKLSSVPVRICLFCICICAQSPRCNPLSGFFSRCRGHWNWHSVSAPSVGHIVYGAFCIHFAEFFCGGPDPTYGIILRQYWRDATWCDNEYWRMWYDLMWYAERVWRDESQWNMSYCNGIWGGVMEYDTNDNKWYHIIWFDIAWMRSHEFRSVELKW